MHNLAGQKIPTHLDRELDQRLHEPKDDFHPAKTYIDRAGSVITGEVNVPPGRTTSPWGLTRRSA
jgi:hypothetical protein